MSGHNAAELLVHSMAATYAATSVAAVVLLDYSTVHPPMEDFSGNHVINKSFRVHVLGTKMSHASMALDIIVFCHQ